MHPDKDVPIPAYASGTEPGANEDTRIARYRTTRLAQTNNLSKRPETVGKFSPLHQMSWLWANQNV
jgi:hypothetical protein